MKKRWAIDVPVDGLQEKCISMKELMRVYNSSKGLDVNTRRAMLEYVCDCQYAPAKLELARLLINNPKVDLKQSDRYSRAEQLLTELANNLDASDEEMAAVSLELAKLYDILNQPVGALAMLLQARRFRTDAVTAKDIELCRRRLSGMDVFSYGTNAKDAYSLGMELVYANGPFKFAELFLREAVDNAKGELKGQACLALADLYADNPKEGRALSREARELYKKAAEYGYPECISRVTDRAVPRHTRNNRAV